jgi:hypothetical protein
MPQYMLIGGGVQLCQPLAPGGARGVGGGGVGVGGWGGGGVLPGPRDLHVSENYG